MKVSDVVLERKVLKNKLGLVLAEEALQTADSE